MLYKQIPKLNLNRRCNLCKRLITSHQTVTLLVYNRSNMLARETTAELLRCDNCGICYADSNIFPTIHNANDGFSASGFMLSGKIDMDYITKCICSYPKGFSDVSIVSEDYIHPHDGFLTEHIQNPNVTAKFFINNIRIDKCPICDSLLHDDVFTVPISTKLGARCPCRSCGNHSFIRHSKEFKYLIKNNPFIKNIEISYKYYFNYFNQTKRILWQNNEHYMMYLLKPMKGRGERYAIISNYTDRSQEMIKILSYKDKEARQILADIYKHKRNCIELDNEIYEVCKTLYKDQRYSSSLDVMVSGIMIKSGGGYYESITNANRFEIVDVLMYSPFTKKYELARVTYDKEDMEYFMDISAFRRFYREYGNPGLSIYAEEKSQSGIGDFSNLRDESIIHQFGYSVSAQANLSAACRQSILADIIDLETMSQKNVIAFIESLIKRFTADKYDEARFKWQQDLKFVINYKVNPQRFIIAKT